jgi:hypothetical protein
MSSIHWLAGLPLGLACIASPAWSMPTLEDSHRAIDLVPGGEHWRDAQEPEPESLPSTSWGVDRQIEPIKTVELQVFNSKAFYAQDLYAQDLYAQDLYAQAKSPPAPTAPVAEVNSPVLEKWQRQVPNVLDEIKRDPSFRTRARLGLAYFPSTFDSLGWNVGVEDVFIGKTNLTASADYQATFTGKRKAGGVTLRYYLFPLGGYVNLAPVLGYRYLETPRYITDGLEVGFRVQFVLSRTGGADVSFTQTWVDPNQGDEVGVSTLSFGYALTHRLRLSTDVQKQNSKQKRDTRFAIGLEWMF